MYILIKVYRDNFLGPHPHRGEQKNCVGVKKKKVRSEDTHNMSTVDELLKGISGALATTKSSVDLLVSSEEDYPAMIKQLLTKLNLDKVEGVSLLALKNNSLLSYLNSIALVLLSHLERLETEEVEEVKTVIENSVTQRVCLEKGVKPLEKKLGYQLDKMVRAYSRMEADESKAEEKAKSKGDDSEDSEDEDEELSYRPDAAALSKMSTSTKADTTEKYKPPKISAMAPPAAPQTKGEKGSTRKLQSMEEYLVEQSETPALDVSIGSTIVNHGRGGVKTLKDRKKEAEIQTYEENNFTRLPNAQTKKSFKQQQHEMVNTFGGEDWSMFNSNSRDIGEDTSRKRKTESTWDRVKKRG